MRTWSRHIWELLRSSYWFIPTLMIAGSIVLAWAMLYVDQLWDPKDLHLPGVYSGGADGARALLATIASSVITVAGVVFSITIATLTQASSQFGPRLLRNFMRDRGNQIVLGTFTATFVYCILIVRSVRGEDELVFVPNASVTVAVGLALLSIGVLIFFIHHVSSNLQAPIVASSAAAELRNAIQATFTRTPAGNPAHLRDDENAIINRQAAARTVLAPAGGYLQALDEEGLLEIATKDNLIIGLYVRPGDFILNKQRVAWVLNAEDCGTDVFERIAGALIIGRYTTAEQDVEFSIRQLVDIASRALSTGVNDPFTAIECVDWLSHTLAAAAMCEEPSPYRRDEQHRLRLVMRTWDFGGIVDAAFNPIRQSAQTCIPVLIRMLDQMTLLAEHVQTQRQRDALLKQTNAIGHHISQLPLAAVDRDVLQARLQRALAALRG